MAWVIIDTLNSPTSGAFTFASLTLTGYKVIRIDISGVTVTTDGTDVGITFYVSGSEVTSGYTWANFGSSTSASSNADSGTSAASILLCSDALNWDTGNASTKSFQATVTVDDPVNTSLYKRANVEAVHIGPTGNAINSSGCGLMTNTGAIDGLKVKGTSNLTAGNVRILGLT